MQTNETEPFLRTTAINMMLALEKRIKGVQGGTSAGKTFGILPILINKAIKNPGLEVSVVAESVPHLKRGAMKDFKKIMIKTKRWNNSAWHSTDSIYRFANGSSVEFFSADNDAKLRGARRDILYMNEANNMTLHAYNELASRTKQDVWMDWNPTSPFWFHEELKGDSDVDFLVINYTHNEACPQSAVDFILKAKEKAKTSKFWENWYNVYGLGEIGSLEGVIFSNWSIIDTIPKEAEIVNYGLDFGYTNDPTTIIYLGKWNGKLILEELCYQTGMVNADIIRKAKETTDGFTYIIADSAEPKSIEEIKRGGVRIKGALKGRDSINFGIDTLQQFDILVTSRSTNLIKELRNYSWDKDKEGKTLNKPIDTYNHCIDAVRYAAESLATKKKFEWYVITE
jgi:phage terminase large subunit